MKDNTWDKVNESMGKIRAKYSDAEWDKLMAESKEHHQAFIDALNKSDNT